MYSTKPESTNVDVQPTVSSATVPISIPTHSGIVIPGLVNNNNTNNVNLQENKKNKKHTVLIIAVVIVIVLAVIAIPLGIYFSANSEESGTQSHRKMTSKSRRKNHYFQFFFCQFEVTNVCAVFCVIVVGYPF